MPDDDWLSYVEVLPEVRGAVPAGLLYVADDLPDADGDAVGLLVDAVLLPDVALLEVLLLVPNEFLPVVETDLTELPFDEEDDDPARMRLLPVVVRRDPLYTSLL